MPNITIDQDLCIQCGACITLCVSAQVYAEVEGETKVAAAEKCWGCGHCVAACPADAISHSGHPIADCPALDAIPLPPLEGLVGAFRERRSCRVFRDDRVPQSVVKELVELARYMPSANN